MPKGDKKRKKEIGEKIAQMEAELDAKHQQELLALNANATNTTETSVRIVLLFSANVMSAFYSLSVNLSNTKK